MKNYSMSNQKSKKRRYFLAGGIILLIVFSFAYKISAKTPINSRLSGKILLQVESKGEAWYVKPDDLKRYYLGRPSDAFYIMQELGLGISEKDYWKFGDFENKGNKAPARLAGKILLRVEEHGEAYYINPSNLEILYLGTPQAAFEVMRNLGLGITNKDLEKIEIGKSVAAVVEARKHIPVKVDPYQKNAEARDAEIARKKAQIIEYKKNCAYDNGCYLYKGVMIRWVVDADEENEPLAKPVTDKDKIDRSIRVLKKGMDKYPEYFFTDKNKEIIAIYVLSHMSVVGSASTYYRKIYLTVCSDDEAENFEQTFHHEYAHLLQELNYDNFPEKEWDKINPEGFKYGKENAAWGGYDEESNRNNGFLRGYAKFGKNEDFAVLVESLFKNPSNSDDNLWMLKEKYKRIGQKVNIVIDFYHKLDPVFTEEYFRKISTD